jgi:hypothetical protein
VRAILLAAAATAAFAQDPVEIVRRSAELDAAYVKLMQQYTYLERQENRQLDASGKVKDRDSRTWDITRLEGSPYRRLISRDDKPLPAKEEAKEQERLRKSIEARRTETPEQRQARMADADRRSRKIHDPIREIPNAFNLKLLGEEYVNGGAAWVIECTPKPGYEPKSNLAHFYPKVRGKLWISKADYQWVKVEAVSIDTISFGAILARVAKGATIRIEQTRVNNEVWMPLRIDIAATARIALVKVFRGQVELTYRDYKKFQVDSHVVSTGGPAR